VRKYRAASLKRASWEECRCQRDDGLRGAVIGRKSAPTTMRPLAVSHWEHRSAVERAWVVGSDAAASAGAKIARKPWRIASGGMAGQGFTGRVALTLLKTMGFIPAP
jgi:hypothetical protein